MQISIVLILLLAGCAVYYPELPGPADKVECTIKREGSLTGEYDCKFNGHYELKKW